jgi:hypothetical protein
MRSYLSGKVAAAQPLISTKVGTSFAGSDGRSVDIVKLRTISKEFLWGTLSAIVTDKTDEGIGKSC